MSAHSDSFKRSNKESTDHSTDIVRFQSTIVDPVDIGYSDKVITGIALFLVFCNVLSNFDHGALPAAIPEIMEELKYDKTDMGSLGSYVYLGFVIGSTINGAVLLEYFSYKTILIISFVLNGIGAFLFCQFKDYHLLAFARFLSGFGQILVVIYCPLYIEALLKKKKAIWLPIITLCGPLGTCIGYSTTGALLSCGHEWRDLFYALSLVMGGCLIIVILLPSTYININEVHDKADSYIKEIQLESEPINDDEQGGLQEDLMEQGSKESSAESLSTRVVYCELLKNLPFIFVMLGTSVLFYVISGVIFWTSDYLRDVLGTNQADVTIGFGIVSITAPVMGAISSIPIANKIGYTSKYTLPTCLVLAFMCYAVAFPIPFTNNFAVVVTCNWFMLFFGGVLLPITQGIMLSQVNKRHQAHSQSLQYLSYNLFGWLPSPLIYGWIVESTGGGNSRWGMIVLVQSIIFANIFTVLAIITTQFKKKEHANETKCIELDIDEPKQLEYSSPQGADSLHNELDGDGGAYRFSQVNSLLESWVLPLSKVSASHIINSSEAQRKKRNKQLQSYDQHTAMINEENLLTETQLNKNHVYNSIQLNPDVLQNLAASTTFLEQAGSSSPTIERKNTL